MRMRINYDGLQEIDAFCRQCTVLIDDPDNIDACDTCDKNIDYREYEIVCPECCNEMTFAPDDSK